MEFFFTNKNFERNGSYRNTFLQNNEPIFLKRYYFCAYCGKPIKKEKVEVDHLYPIGRVKYKRRLKRRLKRKGISNVNDQKNLVPSCKKCNRRKGRKMGMWVIRGKIGRVQKLWYLRHGIRITFLSMLLLYFLFR